MPELRGPSARATEPEAPPFSEATMTTRSTAVPPGSTALRAVERNRALYQEFGLLDEALD
jgi:hypothetical protein